MKILLTNDDGIDAAGLRAVIDSMPKDADVTVVAPRDQKSASSHSITLGEHIEVEKRQGTHFPEYVVAGTPADCVKIAIAEIDDFFPDLVVSGINLGANTGVSVYYSGTISAAREGQINRIPSIAISLCSKTEMIFEPSLKILHQLIEAAKEGLITPHTLMNVNVPAVSQEEIKGTKLTTVADSHFIEEFVPVSEKRNKKVFRLAGEIEIYDADGHSDEEAVQKGYIAITPLRLDLTYHEKMDAWREWLK